MNKYITGGLLATSVASVTLFSTVLPANAAGFELGLIASPTEVQENDLLAGIAEFELLSDPYDLVGNIEIDFTSPFLVRTRSTGAFQPYEGLNLSIKDSVFNKPGLTSISDFLTFSGPGLIDFEVDWNNIEVFNDNISGGSRLIDFSGDAFFKTASGNGDGEGKATAILDINTETGDATLEFRVTDSGGGGFEPIPEPLTMFSSLIALGFGGLLTKSAKDETVEEEA